MQAGDEARELALAQARENLRAARREREEQHVEEKMAEGIKRDIRQDALEKFWPMAELVVERALRGEEVNREQLSAAFKILEQQLGKPSQQKDDPAKDQPSVMVYESAALAPLIDVA